MGSTVKEVNGTARCAAEGLLSVLASVRPLQGNSNY